MEKLVMDGYQESSITFTQWGPSLGIRLVGNHIHSHGLINNIEFMLVTPRVISSHQGTLLSFRHKYIAVLHSSTCHADFSNLTCPRWNSQFFAQKPVPQLSKWYQHPPNCLDQKAESCSPSLLPSSPRNVSCVSTMYHNCNHCPESLLPPPCFSHQYHLPGQLQ